LLPDLYLSLPQKSRDKNAKSEHWDEFIKDILALDNGNYGYADKTGFLIIGAENTLKPDGTRELFDIGDVKLDEKQLIEKLNAACHPKMADIRCEYISLDGKWILVICIPPSPHLHETTRRLKTKRTEYTERIAFVRRTEGIFAATQEERTIIVEEKRRLGPERFDVDVAPIVMAYKERLASRRKLEFIPLDTELMFNAGVTDSDDEPEEIEGEEEEYQGEPLPQPLEKATSKESLKPASILEILWEHTRVTVLGDAGSGKTETAKAFCREFNAAETYNVGIHIPLKPFGDGGMDALIRNELTRRYVGNALPAERLLEKFGSEWNVALIFDGVDECSEMRRKECIRSQSCPICRPLI
jgi:hypothetical protein